MSFLRVPPPPVLLALVVASLGASLALAAPLDAKVERWQRKAGHHSLGFSLPHEGASWLAPASMKLEEKELFDVQVGKKVRYRGVPLKVLVLRGGVPPKHDTALLHFKNGMQVPVATDTRSLDQLGAFVALEVREGERWTSTFPPVPREPEFFMDPRPVTFLGNKLVVEKPGHPDLVDAAGRTFSPWRHVDSLVGIELVNRAAYNRQLEPKAKAPADTAAIAKGRRAFEQRCQFCHGVHGVGARFGWDFATPLPLDKYRSPSQLLEQVTLHKMSTYDSGLMMPAQKDATRQEMEALWRWAAAMSGEGERPAYAP